MINGNFFISYNARDLCVQTDEYGLIDSICVADKNS